MSTINWYVKQDFYAAIYLTNMAALAKNEANEKVALENQDKDLKYDYKVNVNILNFLTWIFLIAS